MGDLSEYWCCTRFRNLISFWNVPNRRWWKGGLAKSGPIDPCDVKLKGCLFYETRSALVGEPFEVETLLAGLLLSDISSYLRNIFYYYQK